MMPKGHHTSRRGKVAETGQVRKHRLTVRLDDTEHEAVVGAAGEAPVAEWARSALLTAATRPRDKAGEEDK